MFVYFMQKNINYREKLFRATVAVAEVDLVSGHAVADSVVDSAAAGAEEGVAALTVDPENRRSDYSSLARYRGCLEKGSDDIGSAVCYTRYTIYLSL